MAIGYYFAVAGVLFAIGLAGILTRRNAIVLFMCVELMLNAVNLTFVAAAEVVIGLAILVNIYWRRGTLDVDVAGLLRG